MAKELPTSVIPQAEPLTPQQVEDLILSGGDLSKITASQRAEFLAGLCAKLGLNPMLKPFDFIPNSKGNLILYANKSLAAQLREIHNISTKMDYAGPLQLGETSFNDIYMVVVTASMPDKNGGYRTQVEMGASFIGGLKGADLANKIMHTMTKATRRATLAIKGIGLPDESELEDTPSLSRALAGNSMKTIAPAKESPLDMKSLRADIKADPVLVGE